MLSFIDLLGYYQNAYTALAGAVECVKDRMRTYLGPQVADQYFILASGDVVASTTTHNHDQDPSALLYKSATRQIVRNAETNEERLQRLPYLTLIHICGDQQYDFSEWITEVRTVRQLSLLQVVRLAGLVHTTYLNEHECSEVHVITRAGDEDVYVFKNTTELVRKLVQTPATDAGTGLELSEHART